MNNTAPTQMTLFQMLAAQQIVLLLLLRYFCLILVFSENQCRKNFDFTAYLAQKDYLTSLIDLGCTRQLWYCGRTNDYCALRHRHSENC